MRKAEYVEFTHRGGTGNGPKENQDAYFLAHIDDQNAVFGVLDGHGGDHGAVAARDEEGEGDEGGHHREGRRLHPPADAASRAEVRDERSEGGVPEQPGIQPGGTPGEAGGGAQPQGAARLNEPLGTPLNAPRMSRESPKKTKKISAV